MNRLETLASWLFTCLGIVLTAVSVLVVPANAFADPGSECAAACSSTDPACFGDCCATLCDGDAMCIAECCANCTDWDVDCVSQAQTLGCAGDDCDTPLAKCSALARPCPTKSNWKVNCGSAAPKT